MTPGLILSALYGILAIAGGIMGYLQAHSKPSLISGLISGVLLLLGTYLASTGNGSGLWLARVIVLLLVGVFIIRWVKTQKFIPAGLMTIVGVATALGLWTAI